MFTLKPRQVDHTVCAHAQGKHQPLCYIKPSGTSLPFPVETNFITGLVWTWLPPLCASHSCPIQPTEFWLAFMVWVKLCSGTSSKTRDSFLSQSLYPSVPVILLAAPLLPWPHYSPCSSPSLLVSIPCWLLFFCLLHEVLAKMSPSAVVLESKPNAQVTPPFIHPNQTISWILDLTFSLAFQIEPAQH